MLTEWVVRTPVGKSCCGPIAISRNSPGVPVGRQISSAAEPSPPPPRAPHDVTLHGPPLAGSCGTAKEGEAGSVALWTTVKFAAPAPSGWSGGVAAAPMVVVSAEAAGAAHSAAINPI